MKYVEHFCIDLIHLFKKQKFLVVVLLCAVGVVSCLSPVPQGLGTSGDSNVQVKFDFLNKPLPEIPLPNDIATRYDPLSATGRRINASMVAPTQLESHVRSKIDQLDGWGLLMPISIPFTGEIDVSSILEHHRDANYDPSDDVIYLIDIDPKSTEYKSLKMLDIGQGNYPLPTENRERYFPNDPRVYTLTTWFEEVDEDSNQNGLLDPGEDSDGDGVLDRPNYLPNFQSPKDYPATEDMQARADAIMSFYERETNTLIAIPVTPLRPRTQYAVVITKRLKDKTGTSVGSPFDLIHHSSQTQALSELPDILKEHDLNVDDVAFTFTFTTQTTISEFIAVRDGLYGHGVQKNIGEQFPPQIKTIEQMKDPEKFTTSKNLQILYGEEFESALRLLNIRFRDGEGGSRALDQLLEANKYVDYYVIGSFEAPQLFFREDENGDKIPMNDQSWPADLHRVPAPARGEQIYFTLVVPRKEVSVRKDGKPAPVAILGHGHTGNRFDAINLGPFFARYGLATIAIDNPGHGLEIAEEDRQQVFDLFNIFGLKSFVKAAFKDRSFDQNFNGESDSGADFWDFYMFHTRDNVRQTALDYMSLIRLIRSFDSERKWNFDLDNDGVAELAGDFDADGVIDIGVGSPITMTGASLGGIMSMLMGCIEPEIEAIAPIVGAGGLGLVSRRSMNQSVRNAVLSRAFGPMYIVSPKEEGGSILEAVVTNLTNSPSRVPLATLQDVQAGDTLEVHNLRSDEHECGRINQDGLGRAPMASDIGDPLVIHLYRGDVIVGKNCQLIEGSKPYAMINRFETSVSFWDQSHAANEPLVALSEGLGLRRATPDFRRFAGLGPLVLDRTDPAVLARHMQMEPITYPGTGQTTGAHALITTGIGDLNVPVDGGATFARAAGILEWKKNHPHWGVPENQVLIDYYVLEAVEELKRYTDLDGNGVLIDPDNFSQDNDLWAGQVDRLDPPLRAGWQREDHLQGRSASIYAYGDPKGKHGFDLPGIMTDRAAKRCTDSCAEGESCDCSSVEVFDVGNFHFNLIADYLKNRGKALEARACYATFDCPETPNAPTARTFP
jgi:hypothetical protein